MRKLLLWLTLSLFTVGFSQAQDWDFELDPIEIEPVEPTSYDQAAGNWGAITMGTQELYDSIRAKATRPVAVFIFDTAGDFDHPSTEPYQGQGRTFTGESSGADLHGHGTHVVSSVMGVHPNGTPLGVAAPVAEKGLIKVYAYKVLNNSGSGTYSWIAQALGVANGEAQRLIDDGWFVIYSFSLGGGGSSSAIEAGFAQARSLGVYITAASGNNGQRRISYPALSEHAAAIGALQQGMTRASFSNYGPELFLTAPGVGIYGAWKNGAYANLSGTSMATPHIAGAAAVIASIYPTVTNTELDVYLAEVATDRGPAGWDEQYGHGWIDLRKVWAFPPDSVPDNPDPDPDPDPEPPTDDPEEILDDRYVYYVYEDIDLMWRYPNGEWQRSQMDVRMGYKHGFRAEDKAPYFDSLITDYYSRHAFQIREWDDELALGNWAVYFADMMIGRDQGIDIDALNGRVFSDRIDVVLTEKYLDTDLRKVLPRTKVRKEKAVKRSFVDWLFGRNKPAAVSQQEPMVVIRPQE